MSDRATEAKGTDEPGHTDRGTGRAPTRVVRVPIRPKGVPSGVSRWTYGPGKGLITSDQNEFNKLAEGRTIFQFDKHADKENIEILIREEARNFTSQVVKALTSPVDKDGLDKKSSPTKANRTTRTPKSEFALLGENLALAGGIMSFDLPNENGGGKPTGMVGGQNLAATGSSAAQIPLASLQIILGYADVIDAPNAVREAFALFRGLAAGAKKLVFRHITPELAAHLMGNRSVRNYLADALAKSGYILRYDTLRVFTSKLPTFLQRTYQAHHIIEQQALKLGGHSLGAAPAILLEISEHTEVHRALNEALKHTEKTKTAFWAAYQSVYKKMGHADWLPVIAPYFR